MVSKFLSWQKDIRLGHLWHVLDEQVICKETLLFLCLTVSQKTGWVMHIDHIVAVLVIHHFLFIIVRVTIRVNVINNLLVWLLLRHLHAPSLRATMSPWLGPSLTPWTAFTLLLPDHGCSERVRPDHNGWLIVFIIYHFSHSIRLNWFI